MKVFEEAAGMFKIGKKYSNIFQPELEIHPDPHPHPSGKINEPNPDVEIGLSLARI